MSTQHLQYLNKHGKLPDKHVQFLQQLSKKFTPKVIYDIGSSVLHWTNVAEKLWKESTIILFDGFEKYEPLYKGYQYNIDVLSDTDNKKVTFYTNDTHPGGNSYYKENNDLVFPSSCGTIKITRTLDSIVSEKKFPFPNLIKLDVQGAEIDILKGGEKTVSNASFIILEAQDSDYNIDAPKVDKVMEYMKSIGWIYLGVVCNSIYDADYCFINPKNIKHEELKLNGK